MKKAGNLFEMMISLEHLFQSWDQFKRGKCKRKDIQIFERNLEDRIFDLHDQLATLQYCPDNYDHFFIKDHINAESRWRREKNSLRRYSIPNGRELPQPTYSDVLVIVAVGAHVRARRGEAPYNYFVTIDLFDTAGIGPRIISKES